MAVDGKALHWNRLGEKLSGRLITPLAHPSFVLFFLASVVLVGGAGVWLELYNYIYTDAPILGLRTAVLTFFPALAGSSCMQIILEENVDRALRSFAMTMLVAISALALWVAPSAIIGNSSALFVSFIGSLLALCLWWVANADQPAFRDDRLDSPLGNATTERLAGSLDDLTT